jgi:hypothetical protein
MAFGNESVDTLVAGDICPIGLNEGPFCRGETDSILNDLRELFLECAITVANLECPLIDRMSPILKVGPNLGAPTCCANGLSSLPLHCINLANNHIRDHGPTGVLTTLRSLDAAKIDHFGAGENLDEASRVLIREAHGIRIGFLGVADREFSIADEKTPGAAPLDEISIYNTLTRCKKTWDVLIVLVHSGISGYCYPSPRLQRICRFIADLGANAVFCQHSHCIGTYEVYAGSLIVYGQGNFIFGQRGISMNRQWNEGILVRLSLDHNGIRGYTFVPFTQRNTGVGVERLAGKKAQVVLNEIDERSRNLGDSSWVQRRWLEYCHAMQKQYFLEIAGYSPLARRILRRITDALQLSWPSIPADRRIQIGNLIRCGDHREVLETLLLDRLQGDPE